MTYTEEQRYIDSEYPENLTAKLRAADIHDTDPLPAWAVRELQNNLLSDMPTFDPGDALAGRVSRGLRRSTIRETRGFGHLPPSARRRPDHPLPYSRR